MWIGRHAVYDCGIGVVREERRRQREDGRDEERNDDDGSDYVEQGVGVIAADNCLVIVDVDTSCLTHIALAVEVEVCYAEILCDNDSVGRVRSGVLFQVVEGGDLHYLAEESADVSSLDAAGCVVGAVAGESLETVCVQQPELTVGACVGGKCHSGRTLSKCKVRVGIIDDLVVKIVAQVILLHGNNVPVLGLVGLTSVHDYGVSGRNAVALGSQQPSGLGVDQFEEGAL